MPPDRARALYREALFLVGELGDGPLPQDDPFCEIEISYAGQTLRFFNLCESIRSGQDTQVLPFLHRKTASSG